MLPHARTEFARDDPGTYSRSIVPKIKSVGYLQSENIFMRMGFGVTRDYACCKQSIIEISCTLCGFDIKTYYNSMTGDLHKKINEVHSHDIPRFPLMYPDFTLIDQSVWMMNQKIKEQGLLCFVCKEQIADAESCRRINSRSKRHSMAHMLSKIFENHTTSCKGIKKIRKSIDVEAERAIVLSVVKEIIDEIENRDETFTEELPYFYKHLMDIKDCECGSSMIVTCKICGTEKKSKFYHRPLHLIVSNHFRSDGPYDYTMFLTPIMGAMEKFPIIDNGGFDWDEFTGDIAKTTIIHIKKRQCDGYKCSICGMKYLTARINTVENNYPAEDIVVAHISECIPAHKDKFANEGRLCI